MLQPGAAIAAADCRAPGATTSWKMKTKLIHEPGKFQDDAVRELLHYGSGILVAAPGKGKTVMGLAAMAGTGRRSLVIVPTTVLLDQWISRALEHTSLGRHEIGIVQGDACEWNRHLVVGMIHSLSQRTYPDELYRQIGVCVFDECHRMSAPHFSTVAPKFPAGIRWGLSATPQRPDGLHRIFEYHCGPVLYEMLELDVKPTVFQMYTRVSLPTFAYTNAWNGQPNFSKAFTSLSKEKGRNEMLAGEMAKCHKAGRKVLVLSKRVQHLETLFGLAVARGIPQEVMGIITGNVQGRDRQNVLAHRRVILAIESIAGLGLDQPDLDTLIFALPSQSVEQTIGRIEREHPKKKPPLVVDPVDDVPLFARLARSRSKKYRERGYEVVTVRKS